MVMVAQLCEYTKNHVISIFKNKEKNVVDGEELAELKQ